MTRAFDIVGKISDVEVIAEGQEIRVIDWLRQEFGAGKWRKMKGIATIRYYNGVTTKAELHWYEAHGIGRVDIKVKREL